MAFDTGVVAGRLKINMHEVERLLESSAMARELGRRGELGVQEAKRLCPTSARGHYLPDNTTRVPPGHLRSSIYWDVGRDNDGLYVDIGSTAPKAEVFAVEYGTRPHVIESHGPWPLRNRITGEVFGRRVNHPGTDAQPFLRPALERAARG